MAGTFSPSDMELTPAKLYFKAVGATASTYLGATLGNVKVAFSFEKAEIKADQTGTTPLDKRVSGVKVTLSTEIAQIKDFELFNLIYPHSVLVGGAPFNGTAPSAAVQWNNTVGASDIAVAGELTLHPQSFPDANISYDYTFFKAVASEAADVEYGPTKQSALKLDFTVYPDVSTDPFRFFRYGNKNF